MENYFEEETEPGLATTYSSTAQVRISSPSRSAQSGRSPKKTTITSLDNKNAPQVFHGHSNEDAADFLKYVERFSTYKQMDDAEKLQFVAILFWGAAGDFLDTFEFPTDCEDPWDFFKTAFLARFGRLEATTWRDVQQMFATPQAAGEAASDFIARMTHAAKRVDVDDKLLRMAIMSGLKPELRTHVLQSQHSTLEDLTHTARIADAAVTTSNPGLSQVLEELRTSNAQHAKHNAAFQQLTARLDKMQISPVTANAAETSRRVRFSNSPTRARSPGRLPQRNFEGRRRSTSFYRQPPNNSRDFDRCGRCGRQHGSSPCPALHGRCLNCNRPGHFKAVCRSGPRFNFSK